MSLDQIVTIALWAVAGYAGIGILFAFFFVLRGAGRIDPDAAKGTRGFRALIFPGAAALWPLLLKRWLGGQRNPPVERNDHRRRAAEANS